MQRVGQDIFRRGLLEYWDGRCAITGLAVPELLRASHIKPWAACDTDAERLDIFNGLLLAPHLDAAFDAGFITIAKDGAVLVSNTLPPHAWSPIGLDGHCTCPDCTVTTSAICVCTGSKSSARMGRRQHLLDLPCSSPSSTIVPS